jgi:hypothetical protein
MNTTTSTPGRNERHENIGNPSLTSWHELLISTSGVLVVGFGPLLDMA